MLDEAHRLVATWHWNRLDAKKSPTRIRWWESRRIVRHVNRKICGRPLEALGAGLPALVSRRFPDRTFPKAISVGCGTGFKEMMFVQAGLVDHFHLFELSKSRIQQGEALAEELGIADRVTFHNRDGMSCREAGSFDLVYWNNALHHMPDVDRAIAWSRDHLNDQGIFVMDDFVGPPRMQWSERTLGLATRVRKALPERSLRNPYRPDRSLPAKVRRPIWLAIYLSDPTECADSGRILDGLARWFPAAEVIPTGGVVYNLALMDVIHNLDEVEDAALIDRLLRMDDRCTSLGEFHYAVAIAPKS
jgi:SAM-dependent methyltransferase